LYHLRHNLFTALKEARKAKGLSQAALAKASGTARVTIARLESGLLKDCRAGTLILLCEALGLDLMATAKGAAPADAGSLEKARERAIRLDARRRHAALAAALLAIAPDKAAEMIAQARATVERWNTEGLGSKAAVTHWRARLEGPVRTVALRLLEHGESTDAMLANTPWSFALEPPAA
jgi:transcriptional regulator with XRE-family HTH domain